jgi:hypothetical protein
MKNKFLLGGGILLFLLVLVVGTAYADTNGGVINACVKDNGQVRIVNQASDCKNQETYIYWNIVGPQGPKGDTGATGLQGAQGLQGPKGDKGDTGDTGAIGPQGLQGDKGNKGDTGETGAIGPQGLQGEKGNKGDTGETGAIGPQGLQGDKGDKGDTGAVGPAGQQGPQGIPGNLALAGQMCPAGQYVIGFDANGAIICTETVLPTATPVPTAPPTPVSNALITPESKDVNCRFGPNTAFLSVGELNVGVTVPITGTIADHSWWQIDNPIAHGTPCWVAGDVITTSGDLSLVPVVPIPTGLVITVGVTTTAVIHGTCGGPNPTSFQVSITTNGPALVTYHVEIYGEKGILSKGDDETRTFSSASTQTFDPGGSYHTDCGNFWIMAIVTAPNNMSAEAGWSVIST